MTPTWPKVRLKFAIDKIGSGKTPLGGAATYVSSGIMLLRSQNIHFDGLRLEEVVFIDEDTDAQMASTRVQPDDVLLNITGASLGRCTIAPKDISSANVNQHVCILRPNPKHVEPRFLNMALQSAPVQRAIFVGENGSSREGLTFEQVGNFEIVLPPLPDQQAIADYLDRETVLLDGLVAAKERVLGLLAEKRRALITSAVTRGLDPLAPLHDSGIPWLGEIPAHWRIKRLRWLIRTIEQGWSPEAENREPFEDEWAVLKLNAVAHGQFNSSAAKALPAGLEARADLEVHPGDFLITRANTPALVGDACFVTKVRTQLMLCDLIYRLRLLDDRLDGQYLNYFFTSPKGREQIESDARGTSNSMVKISQEHIKNWWLPLPPIDQQRAIVAYIAAETDKLDALRAATERTIALIKERRSALIAAAVTGRKIIHESTKENLPGADGCQGN